VPQVVIIVDRQRVMGLHVPRERGVVSGVV